MLHWCICAILGAQRTKAKPKKKQWWRPWVDHASSRLNPTNSFFSLPPLSLALLSLTRTLRIPMLPGALKAPSYQIRSFQMLIILCLYLRVLVRKTIGFNRIDKNIWALMQKVPQIEMRKMSVEGKWSTSGGLFEPSWLVSPEESSAGNHSPSDCEAKKWSWAAFILCSRIKSLFILCLQTWSPSR